MEKDFEEFYESIINVITGLDVESIEDALYAVKTNHPEQSEGYTEVSMALVEPWEVGAVAFQPGMDEMEDCNLTEYYMKHGLLNCSPFKSQLIEILKFIDEYGY